MKNLPTRQGICSDLRLGIADLGFEVYIYFGNAALAHFFGFTNNPGKNMTAGYSGTPLVKKLGIKAGCKAVILNPPENYGKILGELPQDTTILSRLTSTADFIQFFTKERVELEAQFPHLKAALAPNGMLWISWPKKSSKINSDLNENLIREIGLQNGLVDVKVCAVDEDWSGLKFVYRLKDR